MIVLSGWLGNDLQSPLERKKEKGREGGREGRYRQSESHLRPEEKRWGRNNTLGKQAV